MIDKENNTVEVTFNNNRNNFITYDNDEKAFYVEAYDAIPKNYTVTLNVTEYINLKVLS